jgi:hypothetical protein
MKIKVLLFFAFCLGLTPNLLAQNDIVTAEKALAILKQANPDLFKNDFNIYMFPEFLAANTKIKYVRTISTPDSASWVFFIDERPYESWAHPCSYIFVNSITGRIKVTKSDFPPDLNKMRNIKLKSIPPDGKHFSFAQNNIKTLTLDASHDYAVIINGGLDNCNNHYRYWNDCSAIYSALVNVYGYNKSHIKVLMSDGTSSGQDRVLSITYDQWGQPVYTRDSSPQDLDGDGTNDINYSATKANIQTVFNNLAGILTSQDHLFIFTTDHGGPDPNDASHVIMNLWGETMRDNELAVEINKVHPSLINIVMGQCNSGGFIDDLSGNFRTIATACTQNEVSWARADHTYDEFLYQWISAVSSRTPEGLIVNADANGDGWVSVQEAFNYVVNHDIAPETPQYNSLTPGVGCISRLANNCYLPLTNPTLLCTVGQTFTVNNIPAGCTVSWTPSSNLNVLSASGNTALIAAKANSNSSGSIQVNVVSTTCSSVSIPLYTLWAGTPQITNQKVDGNYYSPGNQICPGNHWLNVTPIGGNAGTATWTVPSGIPYSVGTNLLNFTFPSSFSSAAITVRSANSCGTGVNWNFYLSKKPYGCTGYYAMTVYPNPASDNVTITIDEEIPLVTNNDGDLSTVEMNNTQVVEPITYIIKIYNNQSTLLSSISRSGKSFNIPLINMRDGTYIIEVSDGKNSYRQPLIVKHN